MQALDLPLLLERHHLCVMRSEIAPKLADGKPVPTSVVWNPLDSPTSAEVAQTQKTLAERDKILWDMGSVDSINVAERLARDEDSGYFGMLVPERGDDGEGDPGELADAPVASTQGGEVLPSASLNGAQIASMIEVVQSTLSGDIPYDSGVSVLMLSFQLSREDAESVLGTRPAPATLIENQATSGPA